MKKEIWKPVFMWEKLYEVSNLGKVRSIRRNRELKLIPKPSRGSNYMTVFLSDKGRAIKVNVHRLVAEAFIPNPENKLQVNHINCIKNDNRVENLEWVTAEENLKHSRQNGLSRSRQNLQNVKVKIDTRDKINSKRFLLSLRLNRSVSLHEIIEIQDNLISIEEIYRYLRV